MQPRDIGLDTKERLPGGLTRHSRGRGPVPDMDESSKGLTPKRQRQNSPMQHGDDAMFHSSVGTNEGDPVEDTRMGGDFDKAMDIRVDELQECCRVM